MREEFPLPEVIPNGSEILEKLRQKSKDSLYFLCKAVLGFKEFSPTLHRKMCESAEEVLKAYKEKRGLRVIELWPRSHFKTSCFSIGLPIWLYLNDQNIRVLLSGSTATNASKRLVRIERVFTNNQLFALLFPEFCVLSKRGTKWTEEEALLPRSADFVESTFEAIGVGGRVTGRHYNVVIPDDLIDEACLGPDGLPSEVMMKQACQWHDYMDFLFEVPELGIEVMPCTRWAQNDVVGHVQTTDPRYEIHRHSALGGCCADHPSGEVIFPERFTTEGLAVQRQKDSYKFALQMLNDPINPDITDFHLKWLKYYALDPRGNFILDMQGFGRA